jgi:hypothetical protein
MAKGQKTGGKNFRPGVSGNPAGRPPLPADLKAARQMNRVALERLLNEILYLTKEELKERFKDPETPAVERMVIQLVRSACWGGNYLKIGFLIKQLCPAPPAGSEPAGAAGARTFVDLIREAEKARRGKG